MIKYGNNDVFEGNFVNGMIQGSGTIIYNDGSKFEGEFEKNQKVRGTIYYGNGDKYVGEFKNDQKCGKGSYFFCK